MDVAGLVSGASELRITSCSCLLVRRYRQRQRVNRARLLQLLNGGPSSLVLHVLDEGKTRVGGSGHEPSRYSGHVE
jgi:hypothetical protein